MTDLSIILVNWNCIDFTEQCIASIGAVAHPFEYEVILVDNASADAPCRNLAERFPWVKIILSDENIGFGRANNLAAGNSTGRVLFFLNPDTLVLGDAIGLMLAELERDPQAGAVGCRLLNPDRTLQLTSVQRFPTIANQLLAVDGLIKRFPNLPLWSKQALSRPKPNQVSVVDLVSGAAIMVRRDVFEHVGGFNPEYFMYAEEVELCYAIRAAGWKTLHVSDAEITHFGGQSTKICEDGFAAITCRESTYHYFCRTRGESYALVYRTGLLLSAVFRLSFLALLSPFIATVGIPLKRKNAGRAFRKWLKIARWSIGREPAVRGSSQTAAASIASGDNCAPVNSSRA